MKDSQWHLAQNLSFRYALTENSLWPKNRTRIKATGTAFAGKHNTEGTNNSH